MSLTAGLPSALLPQPLTLAGGRAPRAWRAHLANLTSLAGRLATPV